MNTTIEIHNGDIIRLKNDPTRDWVAISHKNCNMKYNKNIKDNTGYFLFGGLWYEDEGGYLTDKAYGKCIGGLTRGMFNNIEVVGNISNKNDYQSYKKNERI